MCDYSQYIEESRSQWKNKDGANFNQINKKKIKKKLFKKWKEISIKEI